VSQPDNNRWNEAVTDADLMAERYGRPNHDPRLARRLSILGVTILVLGVAAVFWWSQSGGDRIQPTVTGYRVTSDSSITVSFTVTKPAGRRVSCRVVGEDRSMTVIGKLDVTLPAAPSEVAQTVTLPTFGRAVTGIVQSCMSLN
jgi:hypothetical protein